MLSKLKEIFRWRQLIFTLAIKDLKIKYRRASGGFGWMLVMPLIQMAVFTFIFRFLFRVRIENYPLFLLSGLFPWSYLRASIDGAANSIITNSNLIKKTYFPREALPIASILGNLITFSVSLILLFIVCIFLTKKPLPIIFWLPVLILIQTIFILGISFAISSLNACFREIYFVIDIILLIWFFATPVVYSIEMAKTVLPAVLFKIYMLNPMVGIIDGYHKLFIYGKAPNFLFLIASLIFSLVSFFLGFKIFKKYKDIFADLL